MFFFAFNRKTPIWLVEVVYGRIGTRGRRIRYVVEDKDEARKLVRRNLPRRATDRKRIGPHKW
jgi:hypothetical protein